MRSKDGRSASAEETNRVMKHILATCRKHHVAPGLHRGSAEEALLRIEEGWQFLAVGSELRMMLEGVNAAVRKLGIGEMKKEMAKY
jgi:4-hydroxy-2-oxoheptanedioate aldolase